MPPKIVGNKACKTCGKSFPYTKDYFHYSNRTKVKSGYSLTSDCKSCRNTGLTKARLTLWHQRKKDGLCYLCGAKLDEPPRKSCMACRAKLREQFVGYKTRFEVKKARHAALKLKIFEAYGGARCACCGDTHLAFLSIDHINGDGALHRKTVPGPLLYPWLRRNNFPPGFQVLCRNCNWAKGMYGICPHEQERTTPSI
jgi:hypothetical protein